MPLYDLTCPGCGYTEERLVRSYEPDAPCPKCDSKMVKLPTLGIMVKMKGEGGYPSRRKQVFNTTMRKHPGLT